MTYTISRAEQVLQTQRQALNLRWYPHYHLAARAGWINDEEFAALAKPLQKSGYGRYMQGLLA